MNNTENFNNFYSPERINATKESLQKLWDLQTVDRMLCVLYAMPLKQQPILTDDMTGIQQEFLTQWQSICEHSEWEDDYIPGFSPGIDQAMLPAYFGCTVETSPATLRISPVINKPDDVYNLPKLGFGNETLVGKMLERMRYFHDESQGILPVYEADLQGPFSVASQVWGIEDFLIAIYDYSDEVHHLLSLCTDLVIEFAKRMREIVNGNWIPYHCAPAVWLPPDKGIAYSEDLLAVVSPEIVNKFMTPYCKRIADEFGGVILHSCGNINHLVEEFNKMPWLIGVNFSSSETDLVQFASDARDSLILTVHNSPVSCKGLPILSPIEHFQLCKKVFNQTHDRILCQIFGGIDAEALINEWKIP